MSNIKLNESKLTDERKEFLDELAAKIDEYATQADEHVTSTESSHAEFLQDWYYGEARLDDLTLDRFDDEALADDIRHFAKQNGMSKLIELLSPLVSIELVGIHYQTSEILSVSLGECEEQMPDDLADQVKALTKEEQEYVRRQMSNAYLGNSCPDCIYLNHDYDRFVLILDEEAARKALDKAEAKQRLSRKDISDYLENMCAFRDYKFKAASQFGKLSIARSINLLDPTKAELEDALSTFSRDGYSQIIIYTTPKAKVGAK